MQGFVQTFVEPRRLKGIAMDAGFDERMCKEVRYCLRTGRRRGAAGCNVWVPNCFTPELALQLCDTPGQRLQLSSSDNVNEIRFSAQTPQTN